MRNIIFLGLISFFMDISSEMVYSIILLYLTSAFGGHKALDVEYCGTTLEVQCRSYLVQECLQWLRCYFDYFLELRQNRRVDFKPFFCYNESTHLHGGV